MRRNISSLVDIATEVAIESFDKHIARTLTVPEHDQLRHQMHSDLDPKKPLSVKIALEELDFDKEELAKIVAHATSPETLFTAMNIFLHDKLEELFYVTNDLPTAHMKRDLFHQYVEANIAALESAQCITKEHKTAFRGLVHVYDMGLQSYPIIRQQVRLRSGERYQSLKLWAADRLWEERGAVKAAKRPTPQEVHMRTRELMCEIMNEEYGKNYSLEHPPHPCMVKCLQTINTIMNRFATNLQVTHPGISEEERQERIDNAYKTLNDKFGALHRQHPTQLGFLLLKDYLSKAHSSVYQVPQRYEQVLERCLKQAHKTALKCLPARHAEWRGEQKLNWGEGRNYPAIEELNIGTAQRAKVGLVEFSEKMEKMLLRSGFVLSRENTVTLMDTVAGSVTKHVFFAVTEPSLLLVMQDYMDAFTRCLAEEFKAAKLPCKEVVDALGAVKARYGYSYRSYLAGQDCMLDYTNNAYDDAGICAMMDKIAARGKGFMQLTPKEKNQIPEKAKDIYSDAAKCLKLPKDLATEPMMYLIFKLCYEKALGEYRDAHRQEPVPYTDKIRAEPSPKRRELRRAVKLAEAIHQQVNARAHILFDETMALFPGGKTTVEVDESGKKRTIQRQPEFEAEMLRGVVEYFDRAAEHGRFM